MTVKKRVGLLGGTFDPPHYGHMLMAERAYEEMNLDEIWFIPSYIPPHKAEAKTDVADRIKMLELSVADRPSFYIETIEIERQGKSFTIDTVQELQKQNKDTEFFFIIGGDMVDYLPKWHRIDELAELITFIGIQRQGYTTKSPYPVKEVEMPIIEISSTDIRGRIANGKSIRYLTSPHVIDFIKEKGLYRKLM